MLFPGRFLFDNQSPAHVYYRWKLYSILNVSSLNCILKIEFITSTYSKTCVKRPLSKRLKIGFQDQLSLNAGQKCCRVLQGEHSAIILTFIKLPFVIKIFVLSIFEWPFCTGFTVYHNNFSCILIEG